MTFLRRMLTVATVFGSLLLAGVQPALAQKGAQPAAPLPQPTRWGALLVSGDGSIPAFDNMVQGLARRLNSPAFPHGNIVTVTARSQSAAPATVAGIAQAAGQLRLAPTDGCMVFLTAHGSPQGLGIAQRGEVLSPRMLDRIVDSACGQRATVVIVSACFSGIFAGREMARPNRVILTAARPDRTSFGCSADNILTVFDGCFLQSVRPGTAWRDVAAASRSCVAAEERRLGVLASEPQFTVGPSVDRLVAP